MTRSVAILGAGGWGTALAAMWRSSGLDARLWTPFAAEAAAMTARGENRDYLPGVPLPRDLPITSDATSALTGAEYVVFAVPSRYLGTVAESVKEFVPAKALIVSAVKGLQVSDRLPPLRMTEVLSSRIGVAPRRIAALSGPSHAEEVGRRLPTTIVLAGDDVEEAREVFSTETFRVYTSNDIVGVELGGTLKNPIAIAAGIGAGLGAGDNAMGALVTRGIAEITRLGVAVGAEAKTFAGLSGIGDLVTTCASLHSRNRRVGMELARGKKIDEITASMKMIAEGVETSLIASQWAESIGVETPIIAAVKAVIYDGADPKIELKKLMTRSLKSEF